MPRSGSLTRRKQQQSQLNLQNAVLYCRASTDEQENSIEGQIHAGKAFAQARGICIEKIYEDLGTSAIKTNFFERPKVVEMIKYCKKNNISQIIIHKPTRIFRSVLDMCLSFKELSEINIYIRLISPDIDLTNPYGKLTLQLLIAAAELEMETKTEAVDSAYDAMRRSRVSRNGSETAGNPNANAPYGWRNATTPNGINAKGKPIYPQSPDPAEQAVLQFILEEYQSAKGSHGALTKISRKLNMDLKIPSPSAGKTLIKKGGISYTPDPHWTPAKVASVIEHAVPALPEELPVEIPPLTAAATIIQQRLSNATPA